MLAVSVRRDPLHRAAPDLDRRPLPGLQPLPQQGQVELSILQLQRQEAGRRDLDLDLDRGRGLREAIEDSRQVARRQFRGNAQADGAMHRRGAHRAHDVVVERKQLACSPEQILPLLVQLDAAALAPDNHGLTEHSFEPLHLKRDCRLRAPDAGGCAGEALFLRDGDEASQQIEVKIPPGCPWS